MSDLKPCPFCGSEPQKVQSRYGWDSPRRAHALLHGSTKCLVAGCAGASAWVKVVAWNRRAEEPSPLSDRVGCLEAHVLGEHPRGIAGLVERVESLELRMREGSDE